MHETHDRARRSKVQSWVKVGSISSRLGGRYRSLNATRSCGRGGSARDTNRSSSAGSGPAGWPARTPRADYRLRPHRRHCPGSRSRSRSSRPRLQPGARAPAVDVDASGAGVKSAARDQHITGAIDIADRPHALAEGCALLGLRRGDLEDLILWGPRRAPSRPPARSIRQPRCPSPRGQWSTDRLSSAGQAPSRLVAPLAPASAHSADP